MFKQTILITFKFNNTVAQHIKPHSWNAQNFILSFEKIF
jgi:hypothetical protein